MSNCYEILNIPNFSSLEEVKSKYKDLMIKYHPDKGGDSNIFNMFKQAYDYLRDNRDEHDRKLKCKIIFKQD
jgi:curved DNA-binding protein